ncbi:MAG: hypothetical protein M1840_006156 [Geoglossum simile]|nr:MAG: hypothetical protein M1840_006156 [Geoglossum simile]
MQINALLLAAFAGIVAAQSSVKTASAAAPSACAAQNIVDACLVTEKNAVDACGTSNNYSCLCQAWTNVVICYENCPGHPEAFGAQQYKLSYCNAASANPTSAATVTSAPSSAATAAGTSSSAAVRISGTSSGASPAATTSNAAVVGRPVDGGLVMAALGLVGALAL